MHQLFLRYSQIFFSRECTHGYTEYIFKAALMSIRLSAQCAHCSYAGASQFFLSTVPLHCENKHFVAGQRKQS